MKKVMVSIASILLCAVLTACGGNKKADNTEDNDVTVSFTAEETLATEATTSEAKAETEAVPTETEPEAADASSEMDKFYTIMREKAPIYTAFAEEYSTMPMYTTYSLETTVGDVTSKSEMKLIIKDEKNIAMKVKTDDPNAELTDMDIILTDGTYYMLFPSQKSGMYQKMEGEELEETISELKEEGLTPTFDAESAVCESGSTEYNGKTYLYETIDTGDSDALTIYADPDTKEIKYLLKDDVVMELIAAGHDVDDSEFAIPEDYELIDLAELADALSGLTEEEEE